MKVGVCDMDGNPTEPNLTSEITHNITHSIIYYLLHWWFITESRTRITFEDHVSLNSSHQQVVIILFTQCSMFNVHGR